MIIMTNYNDGNSNQHQQVIRCPNCKASIIIDELHEYVNSKPESKIEAIEHEIAMWGLTYYDKVYYVENIVFCPTCGRISHLGDWIGFSGCSSGGCSKK